MVTKPYFPSRGDIVWLDFLLQAGREQRGRRPGLVMSGAEYNRHGLVLVCPITSKVKGYPFEVPVKADSIKGVVLADHLKNLDWKLRNAQFITTAPKPVLTATQQLIAVLLTG